METTLLGCFIEITSKCNGHCPYCYNSSGSDGTHLETDRIYSIIDELDSDCSLTLSGGEPLLHPRFIEILEYAFYKGIHKIRVITNGTRIYSLKRADLFSKCEIQLTLESLNRIVQEKYRGNGSYEVLASIKKNMLKYSNAGRVAVRVNISKRNSKEIESIVDQCLKWNIDVIRFAFLQKKGRALNDYEAIDMESDEAEIIVSQLTKMCEKGNSRIHIEMEECLPNKGCELMDIRNVAISPMITSNGSVYPCTKLTYSFCALGNIYDMNLSEIVNSDEANKLYSELRKRWRVYAECENCNWKRICFKGCPAIAFEKYGTIDSISDNCEYIKQIYSEKLKERIRKGR